MWRSKTYEARKNVDGSLDMGPDKKGWMTELTHTTGVMTYRKAEAQTNQKPSVRATLGPQP